VARSGDDNDTELDFHHRHLIQRNLKKYPSKKKLFWRVLAFTTALATARTAAGWRGVRERAASEPEKLLWTHTHAHAHTQKRSAQPLSHKGKPSRDQSLRRGFQVRFHS
jgi:hypothetical protein